jgi:hypothetical protein
MKGTTKQMSKLATASFALTLIALSIGVTQRAAATSSNYPPLLKPSQQINVNSTGTGATQPIYVRSADFNEDDHEDVISANNQGSGSIGCSISLALNNGDGTFGAPSEISLRGSSASCNIDELRVGDIDLDGHQDALVVDQSDTNPIVFRGDGTGSLTKITLSGTSTGILDGVAFGDLWNDGNTLDIVAADSHGGVRFYQGSVVCTPTCTPVWTYAPSAIPGPLPVFSRIAIADVDGDGKSDDIVTNTSGNNMHVYQGSAPGGVLGFAEFSGSPVSVTVGPSMTTDQIDQSGNDAIMTSNGSIGSPSVSVTRYTGSGFQVDTYSISGGNNTGNPIVTDLNGDGIKDLVVHSFISPYVYDVVRLGIPDGSGNPTGTFGSQINLKTPNGGNNSSIEASDLNGDSVHDILEAGTSGNYVGCRFTGLIPTIDFDGDTKTDFAVFRPSTGYWWILNSSDGSYAGTSFGANGDVPVPGDYDGDAKTDLAVFRPSNSTWYILGSTSGFVATAYGSGGDLPVPGDFDGDGKTDIAVFRPSTGVWYELLSSTSSTASDTFGTSGDKPVPGDYDRDGTTDAAVYRPSNQVWYIHKSSNGATVSDNWGLSTDTPVQGDYDGDRKTDVAVWRANTMAHTGTFYVHLSTTSGTGSYTVGTDTDKPQPDDFDGDGITDAAVWTNSTGAWLVRPSRNPGSPVTTYWGTSSDLPSSTLAPVP